ncbi:MAG: tetratricopeptide repeat protein [Chloroflexota bacterium]
MANTPPQLKVFLCHASEDKPIVRELYDRLRMDGFDPWLDSELLVPGENWPLEIQKAMRASQAVVVCLSEVAIVKEGYIHTEIKTAQSLQMEKPEGTIFFIPLQLEKCDLPFSMRDIQWGKYFEPDGYERLVKALNKRAEQVKVAQGVVKSKKKPAAKAAPKKGNSVRGGDNSVVIGKDANRAVIVPGSGNVINVNYGAPAATQPKEAKTEPPQGGLPPGSHLPFSRNALFTGREKDLEKLASDLTPNPFAKHPNGAPGRRGGSVVITQAITGMGGIGKTQLAVEFAYRYGGQFKGVHWLNLRDPAALDEQIAACGEKMALQPWSEKMPEQVALTLRAWQMDGARLLILDNFESVKDASQVLARFQSPSLRLLITSRHSDWPSTLGLQSVPLDTFTPAESRKFLKKYLKNRSTNEELDQLAERLGRLPLALELAGRYFDGHPRLSVSQYLTRLEQAFEHDSMRGFRADLPNPTQHDLDLLATFTLSWEQVKSDPTQKIFLAAGYCATNTAIPPEIFEKTAELDETACDECTQTLIGLGLLGEEITIHPLLAEFARHLDSDQEIRKKLIGALTEIAVERNAAVDQTGNYSLYTPLLPHVRAVTEKTETIWLEKVGELWNSIGCHIKAMADYQGAKMAFQNALEIAEKSFGSDDSRVATCFNNLGTVQKDLGDLVGAKVNYKHALRIWEKSLGPDHPQVAIGINNLGLALKDMGDLVGAKTACERAIRIWEKSLGPDHPQVAIGVNNLGNVLYGLGDLTGAKVAFERALRIWEKSLGPDHPQVAIGINNLGLTLKDMGDLAEAKVAFERAIKIDETIYGPDHPNVAVRVNNLGGTLHDLGDLVKAKAAFEHALRILKNFLPPEHPNIKITQENLDIVVKMIQQKE